MTKSGVDLSTPNSSVFSTSQTISLTLHPRFHRVAAPFPGVPGFLFPGIKREAGESM
jgi:hypothetical protein